MGVDLRKLNAPLLYNYQYDRLNRLVHMDALRRTDTVRSALSPTVSYKENITYDPNGNIQTYLRNADSSASGVVMDSLHYAYIGGMNRLDHINDSVGASQYGNDIDDQGSGNYTYDSIGEPVGDAAAGVTN
ncbi:MAG: hypothetical protein JST42_19140, partial [Bacteroidetes bacterium]|nr:hypothetical protein [Bacteroidota bacterium]